MDILGTLMALGIERGTVGDIIPGDSTATFICLPEIERYIMENVAKFGGIGVSISKISLDEIVAKEQELTFKTGTVASLRLDAVICLAFSLSRSKANDVISAGLVSLNHELCIQSTKEISEGNIFSVRGLGRAKLSEVGGMSKKGRLFLKIGLYGR